MAGEPTIDVQATCNNCGFAAAPESNEWESVSVPSLGTMTQCPACESTNVHDHR
jgi:predicted Zn-ribbon and HTH transcriptional regulator